MGEKIYDLIIIGAGPAGITASVYAARKYMDFMVITKDVGGQAAWSGAIENYTGYQFVTGPDLTQKFKEHMDKFGINLKMLEDVKRVEKVGENIEVETDKGAYLAKTAIVSSGRDPRKLGVEGEDEFKNRGVTYCATCDAPLFANFDVAVVGGGNSALDAVLQLTKIANKIYLIYRSKELNADQIMVDKAKSSGKVLFYERSQVQKIYGDTLVRGVTVARGDKTEEFAVNGVFIEVGTVPISDFVKGVNKNKLGEIIVNCKSETNVEGLYAAGDVTDVPMKQIIVACGEGAKAAISAFEYLSKKPY